MTERLTLAQARERVAALTSNDSVIDPASIDWTQPARDALMFAGLVPNYYDERETIVAVCLVLLGYQAHLDHEAGKAFSAAAVLRHIDAARATAENGGGVISACALRDVHREIAAGLHYAEPKGH